VGPYCLGDEGVKRNSAMKNRPPPPVPHEHTARWGTGHRGRRVELNATNRSFAEVAGLPLSPSTSPVRPHRPRVVFPVHIDGGNGVYLRDRWTGTIRRMTVPLERRQQRLHPRENIGERPILGVFETDPSTVIPGHE
jgi:hypothetical protein